MALIASLGVAVALATRRLPFAAGLALGAGVAILAYVWLRQAVRRALELEAGRFPKGLVFKLVLRYPLVLTAVYLFYTTHWLPFQAILLGLFVPLAAAGAECLFQLGAAMVELGKRYRRGAVG
jgi:hypothetical protein